jgi:hypothetical protein
VGKNRVFTANIASYYINEQTLSRERIWGYKTEKNRGCLGQIIVGL